MVPMDILDPPWAPDAPEAVPTADYHLVGEALARVPGVRGALIAAWDPAPGPHPVVVGEFLCPTDEVLGSVRAVRWCTREGGAPAATWLPAGTPMLAVPLGSAERPQGAVVLAVEGDAPYLAPLLESVVAGISAGLAVERPLPEIQRLEDIVHDQMARMGELAAIGQMAASVAHELRNPLSSIKGAAQYLRNEYYGDTTLREFLDIILEEVSVLSRITTEFLEDAHLHDCIRRLIQVMKPQMATHGIETVIELDDEVPATLFDTQQMDQVLRNIVLNAIQAMGNGGVLSIRTRQLTAPLPGVEVAISDTGPGIAAEHLGKLFTPFFTTKTKGVGLGLTIVQKIVQNHGGTVSVASDHGRGSTFTIRIPSAPGAESMRTGYHERATAAQGGTG